MALTREKKIRMLKYGGGGAALVAACLLLSFGTVAPCSIAKKMALREMIEKLANDEKLKDNPFGGLALGMVTGAVDSMFEAMSPPRCAYAAVRMAFGIENDNPNNKKADNSTEKKSSPAPGEARPADEVFADVKVPEDGATTSKTEENAKSNSTDESGWQVEKEKSPIDDSDTILLSLKADEAVRSGYRKYYPRLMLRCKENETDAFIGVEDMIRGERDGNFNEYAAVTVRYDSEKAEDRKLGVATNNHAVFFEKAVGEIKRMTSAKKMVVRYFTYDGVVTALFNLEGLENKADMLKTACHWKDK